MTLHYISPIATQSVESSALTLRDFSGRGLIDIRGRDLGGIFQSIRIGEVKRIDSGSLTRLTPEQFVLLADSNTDAAIDWLQLEAGHARVTMTDVTHGYGQMQLMGPLARDVLPKVCGLDFADAAFPNHHAAQSSLAKVRTLIVRFDDENTPAFHLVVSASLAAYVWSVVADAMQQFI